MTGSSDPKPAGDKPLAERTTAAAATPPQAPAASGPARPAPAAAPARASEPPSMAEDVYMRPRSGGFRRAVRSLVSHLVFAMLMVAAAFAWVYHKQIFNRLGDELCTADRLGGYMTKAQAPMSAPPIAVASQPAAAPADARPAATTPQPSPGAPVPQAAVPATPATAPSHAPDARTEIAAPVPSDRQPATSSSPTAAPSAVAMAPAPSTPAAAPPPTGTEPASPATDKNAEPIRLRIEEVPPAKPEAPAAPAQAALPPAAQTTATPAPKTEPPGGNKATLGWPPPSSAQQTQPPAASPPAAPAAATPEAESPGRMAAAAPARPPEPTKDELDSMMNDWQAARQTFAKSKPEAVEAYKRLVSRYPRVVALRGELGNVLYSMGRMNDAAEQYYEAALLHLEGPEPGVAACLVDVIKGIDPERARSLASKVAGKSCPYRRGGQ